MNLKQCEDRIRPYFSSFMDFIRIYLGIGLVIKGIFFLMQPEQLAAQLANFPFANYLAVIPYVHIVGGLMLALGVFVRLAAFAQIPILSGATFLVNLQQMHTMLEREAVEFSALVLFLLVLIFFRGAGNWSILRHSPPPSTNRIQKWMDEHPDVFIDLIRTYLGIGLFIKGVYIMEHGEQLSLLFDQTGGAMLLMVTAAHYAIPAHFAGGLLLTMGLLTRVAALAQLPLLIGAVFCIYLPKLAVLEMRQNLEFTALVLFLLTLITAHGSGRFSVDHALEKSAADQLNPHPAH